MRNVMVRCIFSVLIASLSQVYIHAQEHVQWADQQVLADEWQPFVPNFVHDRQFQNYPRPDTVRQFFGKNVESVHNSLKKSFQTSAANNIDQYAVPPLVGSFNTFGLQTRNPLLEKNIKDSQYLEQSSHFPPKYHHQSSASQPLHRYPTYVPSLPQYQQPANQYHQQSGNQYQQPVNQYQHFSNNNQFLNRLENSLKQTSLLQAPSRTISTSVQVFPPNQQNHFPQANAYFLGAPPKSENYVEEDPLARKQTRPNDFLLSNNVATIYGSKDPGLSIPPPALKTTPYIRPETNHFLFDNVKAPPERYEIPNNYHTLHYNEPQQIKHVIESTKKMTDDTNPSKQVYEQLSHFGRPFSLPKESVTEYSRVKAEKNGEGEGLIHSYSSPVVHYKKEKMKPSQQHYAHLKNNVGRIPVNSLYSDINVPSTPASQLVDYEPGKLQSVKTVTYLPQRDVLQFNEEDVSSNINHYQSGELTKSPFLPTPTESSEAAGFIHYEKYTTPAHEISSKLPQNHKYSNHYHAGTRNRYQPANEVATSKYHAPATESAINSTPQPSYEHDQSKYEYIETTTRKITNRRRKPSKTKTKDYNRHKVNSYADSSTQSAQDYYVSDVSTTEAAAAAQYTPKKKAPVKYTTTTEAVEENYPNYPPSFLKQFHNYPKEYQQDQYSSGQYDSADNYFNSEKEEAKENYPVFSTQSTTTKMPEVTSTTTTTTTLKTRIKSKYGNTTRPRFSIKDYKRTTTVAPLTTALFTPESVTDIQIDLEKKNTRKSLFASRLKNRTESSSTEKDDTGSEPSRKYKPRTRPPSKYRTSSTTPVPETTSERVNTFKPSTANRYRSSTSKYYNRFRTTTEITSNSADDAATSSSDKKPVRTMLYSAKRSSILKPKTTTTPKVEDEFEDDEFENEAEESTNAETIKKNLFRPKMTPKLEKLDDVSQTNIMTSSEEQAEKDKLKNKTVDEATKDTNPITTVSSEEEFDEDDDEEDEEVDDDGPEEPKETEISTESVSKTSTPAVADDRSDDADKVSKVSSLTSIDESSLPASFFRKWSSNDNQKE